MRDPNRLDKFYKDLCYLHKTYQPDIRFGQFCSNFFGWLYQTKHIDLFFPEEADMIEYVREYVGDKNE